MFISLLNDEQRKVFKALAHRVSLSDWEVKDDEGLFMSAVEGALGNVPDLHVTEIFQQIDVSAFNERRAQFMLMVELVTIAVIDGVLREEEKEVLDPLFEKFGIRQEEKMEIYQLAADRAAIWLKVQRLILKGE